MLAELQQKKLRSTVTTERRRRVKVDPKTGEQVVEQYLMRVDVKTGEELGEVVDESRSGPSGAMMADYDGHLKRFRGFDAGQGRWMALDEPQSAAEGAAPDTSAEVTEVTLVTYNVWFGPRTMEEASKFGISEVPEPIDNRRKRTGHLIEQLKQEDPDVVCLQEVQEGDRFLDHLLADPWIRGTYRIAHAVRGADLAYGLAALLRHEKFPSVVSCRVHDFMGFTVHNRIALFLDLPLGAGASLALATSHLDSLGEGKNRAAQLQYVSERLASRTGDLLFCGDMNMTEASKEQALFLRGGHHFRDLGAEAGATMELDDHTGQPERIDRIFHRPALLQPVGPVGVLGQEVSDCSARPSDHFGLSVKLGR